MPHTALLARRMLLLVASTALGLLMAGSVVLAKPPGGGGGGGGTPLPRWVAVPLDPDPTDNDRLLIMDMNDRGDIVGYFSQSSQQYLFVHNGDGSGTFVDPQSLLDPAAGFTNVAPIALNNVGQFVFQADRNGEFGAYLYSPPAGDGNTPAPVPLGGSMQLNDLGELAAVDWDLLVAFTYSAANGLEQIPELNWGQGLRLTALNNVGQIAGYRNSNAFRRSPGSAVDYFAPSASRAWDMNDAGDVAGWLTVSGGDTRGFLYTGDGTLITLGTLGGKGSQAQAINRDRYILGFSDVSTKRGSPVKPFIYHSSFGMINLEKQVDNLSSLPAGTTFGTVFPNIPGNTDFIEWTKLITDDRHILLGTSTVGPCLLVPVQ